MLNNKKFVAFTQVQGFMIGVMFAYIASSPFIFQDSYGLLPLAYSLCFGVNTLSLMQGWSVVASRFSSTEKGLLGGAKLVLLFGVLTASDYFLLSLSLF